MPGLILFGQGETLGGASRFPDNGEPFWNLGVDADLDKASRTIQSGVEPPHSKAARAPLDQGGWTPLWIGWDRHPSCCTARSQRARHW
jgi:hypothetical protein